MPSVIDASIAAKWLLRDERSRAADTVLTLVGDEGAVVPAIFSFELDNILIISERRGRIDPSEVGEALRLLRMLDLRRSVGQLIRELAESGAAELRRAQIRAESANVAARYRGDTRAREFYHDIAAAGSEAIERSLPGEYDSEK